jgi:hypothetical protein
MSAILVLSDQVVAHIPLTDLRDSVKHTRLPLRRELEILKVLAVDVAFRPSQSQVRSQAAGSALNIASPVPWATVSPLEWHRAAPV